MQEERDLVLFSDEDGNDFELEVVDYFFHDGQEYAVLMDADDEEGEHDHDHPHDHDHGHEGHDHDHHHEHGEDCDCDMHQDVYIMKVVQVGEDMEEFIPVEDDKMDELIEVVNQRFAEADEDEE